MRRFVTLSFIIVFTLYSTLAWAITIKGRVTAGDTPLVGVVVTDGENFTVTGKGGRYSLESGDRSKFVYLSLPSGYSAPVEDGVVKFYIPIERDNKSRSYDFSLVKKSEDDNRHGFIAMADPQIYSAKEFALLEEGVADIRETVQSYNLPFHGIAAGDLISHDHTLYPQYNRVMSGAGIPFFNVVGNHDMVVNGRSHETSKWKFEDMFGPDYYSFNVGKIHYVVLNDSFFIGRDYFYIGYLEEKQMVWLQRNLSYVPEGSTVVLAVHIPTTTSKSDRDRFRMERAGVTMANHRGLYNILKPYNTHIISGHTHTNHNEVISPNLFEHVTAAMSGAWWQGELCTDGTPKGYGVYIADGSKLEWYYKSTGKPKEHQMRVYTGEDDPSFKGYVVANVWNCDPLWRVELYEDGVLSSVMERFEGYDPLAREIYSNKDKLEHKWIYPSLSDKFFRAKPKSERSQKMVVVTDRFGNVYKESLRGDSDFDVVIAGGGASGVAAGIRAASMGSKTLIIEEFEWLGGMLTSSGVSASDGNHKLRGGIWSRFRDSLERHYGGVEALNTGWVSRTLFEPSVGDRIFKNMIAGERRATVWYNSLADGVEKVENGWKIRVKKGDEYTEITTRVLIDATELGDIAKKAGVGYDIGMDSRYITGEDIAPELENDIVQDLTYVMVLKDYGRDMTISKPIGYNPSLFYCSTISTKCKNPKEKQRLWSPEMMITYGKLPNNKYMINWPIEGNDYYTNIVELTRDERERELQKAKNHSLSFLYYIQTELGFKNLALADDEFPTVDKFPFIPYHRESRRINGKVRFTINHIKSPYNQSEKLYRTAIGVGDYPVDHHHTRYEGWESLPDLYFYPVPSYGLPLGTLIPEEVKSLVVAEKSISVTNIVNGTTRLQPVVLQIGEAAGVLASIASRDGLEIDQVPVRDVQREILKGGGYLLPYLDLPNDHIHFKPLQRIGVTGIIKGVGANVGWENQTWFNADSVITNRELIEGLNEFYREVHEYEKNWDLASLFKANSGQNPNSLVDLVSISYIFALICNDMTQEEYLKRIAEQWKGTGLKDLSKERTLTRLECAVLMDLILDPFNKFGVDFKGKVIANRSYN